MEAGPRERGRFFRFLLCLLSSASFQGRHIFERQRERERSGFEAVRQTISIVIRQREYQMDKRPCKSCAGGPGFLLSAHALVVG